MKAEQSAPETIDEYIAAFPRDVREILERVRAAVREAAPEAEETIKYEMPTFTLHGRNLVYFSAFKQHVGFYPAPVGNAALRDALAPYASGKGTVKFPFGKPLPLDVIRTIVQFRIAEEAGRAAKRKKS